MNYSTAIEILNNELQMALEKPDCNREEVCKTYLQYALAFGAENPPKDQKINVNYKDNIEIDWMLQAIEKNRKTEWYFEPEKKIA
jgi:hypothetical protein